VPLAAVRKLVKLREGYITKAVEVAELCMKIEKSGRKSVHGKS
jgi:hypothetical protein